MNQALAPAPGVHEAANQLAYAVGHDFMARVRHLTGFLALLDEKHRGSLDEEGKEFLQHCIEAAAYLDEAGAALLRFSRIGRKEQPFEDVDLGASLRAAVAGLEQGHSLELDVAGLPTLRAEPEQMQELWRQLASNALKFCPPGRTPRLRVRARPGASGTHVIDVEDNGAGIPAKDQERVFGMFVQLQARGSTPGTGAGLAIARRIVHRHGGRLAIAASSPEGTLFRIEIPQEPTQ